MQAPGPPLPSVIQLAANLAREALERLRDGSQARRVARIGEPRLEVGLAVGGGTELALQRGVLCLQALDRRQLLAYIRA